MLLDAISFAFHLSLIFSLPLFMLSTSNSIYDLFLTQCQLSSIMLELDTLSQILILIQLSVYESHFDTIKFQLLKLHGNN